MYLAMQEKKKKKSSSYQRPSLTPFTLAEVVELMTRQRHKLEAHGFTVSAIVGLPVFCFVLVCVVTGIPLFWFV